MEQQERPALNSRPLAAGLLLLLIGAALSATGSAAVPPHRDAATITVGGDANYHPLQFLDEAGEATGFDVELIRAAARDQGLQTRFELGDWSDSLQRLERGEIDVVPMFVSADRVERYLFTRPFMLRYHAVFGHDGGPVIWSLDELAGSRVAVQRAGLAWEALRAMPAGVVTIVEVDAESDALVRVEEDQVDYALVPTSLGHETIYRAGLTDLAPLSPPLMERKYALAVSRDRPELVPMLDAGLEHVRNSGLQDELYIKWIGNLGGQDDTSLPGWIAWLLVPLLLAVVGLLAWRRSIRRLPADDDPEAGARLTLLSELHEAIAGGRLDYALQPKLDLRSRQWIGVELLVRWHHPSQGHLPPAAFVPLAEQSGMIGEMTLYLLRRGLEQYRGWPQIDPLLTLSVNVSANDLGNEDLVEAIIAAAGPCGPGLMLEVTETDVMREPRRVAEGTRRLRQHGIRISVDDFGTGHSSLTNLRRLHPDELKIDQSFVINLLQSRSDQAIVRATIALAHDLGAHVTAEGIEDEATLQWLTEAGCDAAQGFVIARPMTPERFNQQLQALGLVVTPYAESTSSAPAP